MWIAVLDLCRERENCNTMHQHMNSFSKVFRVNNETAINMRSWERDKRCHLPFTNCIPHSVSSSSVSLCHMKQIASLTDSGLTVHGWGLRLKGPNLLLQTPPTSLLFLPFPQVSRPSISTAVMAVRKLIAGGIGCAALQTYAVHYLCFYASSWRAFFCTHTHRGARERGPFSSICLKATGLRDNLKTLSY